MASKEIAFPSYEGFGNETVLPTSFPATLGSALLALGILKSVTIIAWDHWNESPRPYRVSSVQAPQNPKTALCRLQCEAVQTAICSTASQIFPPTL